MRVCYVNFGDVRAFRCAGVRYIESNLEHRFAIRGLRGEIRVFERGVVEAVTEREKRLGVVLLVAAIAYEYAFFVDYAIGSGLRVVGIVDWIIFPAALDRYWQPA